jgi:hypothetical protein
MRQRERLELRSPTHPLRGFGKQPYAFVDAAPLGVGFGLLIDSGGSGDISTAGAPASREVISFR